MSDTDAGNVKRLHLGCGRTILEDWINLDAVPGPGVDVVANLEQCAQTPLPFEDNSIDEILARHVIEHVQNTLPLMQELHRVAKPGAMAFLAVPYGSSDDALEDPTHVRQYFVNSFGFFSQPYYWRADYGYRGDWQPRKVVLRCSRSRYEGKSAQEITHDVLSLRNVVLEMIAELEAIKPIREPKRELRQPPKLEFQLIDA